MATVTQTLPNAPWAIQPLTGTVLYSGKDFRWLLGALYNRGGRIGIGDSLWVMPTPGRTDVWSISVMPGQAVLIGDAVYSYTPERYLVTVPTMTAVSLSGFNTATSTTRTHGVWIVVNDASVTGGSTYNAQLVVTEDVGSGAPVPTGATAVWKIANVVIGSGQTQIATANITMVMPRASRAIPAQPLIYASGYQTFVSGTIGQDVMYSIDGNTVRMQGTVSRIAGSLIAGTTYTIGNLGLGYRPTNSRIGLLCGGGPVAVRVVIAPTGDINLTALTDASYASFDGFSYEVF